MLRSSLKVIYKVKLFSCYSFFLCRRIPDRKTKLQNKRGPNFTPQEKEVLTTIIRTCGEGDVLKSRDNSLKVKDKKDRAWTEIHKQFLSAGVSPVARDIDSLRTCYKNLTNKTKKDFAEYRKEVKMTGGGQNPRVLSSISEAMIDLLGNDLKPLENSFDSATDYIQQSEDDVYVIGKEKKDLSSSTEVSDLNAPSSTQSSQSSALANNSLSEDLEVKIVQSPHYPSSVSGCSSKYSKYSDKTRMPASVNYNEKLLTIKAEQLAKEHAQRLLHDAEEHIQRMEFEAELHKLKKRKLELELELTEKRCKKGICEIGFTSHQQENSVNPPA